MTEYIDVTEHIDPGVLGLDKVAATTALSPHARRIQLFVLSRFAEAGQPPSRADLVRLAAEDGIDPEAVLTELAESDVVVFDPAGEIRAAYPFSPTPTAIQVSWNDGPAAYAMCAVDALGISAMLGKPTLITATEPGTGREITIEVDHDRAHWTPPTAVVYHGAVDAPCCPSADRTCGHINFFTSTHAAQAWAARHPTVSGTVLDQPIALAAGIAEFATLLRPHETASTSRPVPGTDTTTSRRVIRMSENQIQAGVQKLTGVVNANLGMPDMFVSLWRLLAETGEPVSVAQAAAAGGWPVEEVQAEFDRQPGVDWTDDGRVAGFGLSLRHTPHAFTFEDRTVYGWCATDVVNFPAILGRAGVVESTCPATGQRIHVELSTDGVLAVDPPEAVVSKVHLTETVGNLRDLCDLGHFFSSPEAAADWAAAHPEGEVVPVAEEFEIGRRAMDKLGWAVSSL